MTEHKEEMIKAVQDILLNEVEYIRQSSKTLDDKIDETDLLLDMIKFLDRYEENTKVLNQYYKSEVER